MNKLEIGDKAMTKQEVFNNKARCIQLAKKHQLLLLQSIRNFVTTEGQSIDGKKYDGRIVNKIEAFLKEKRDFKFFLSKSKGSILLTIEVERFSYTDYCGRNIYIPSVESGIQIPLCDNTEDFKISCEFIFDVCKLRMEKLEKEISNLENAINNYKNAALTRMQLIDRINEYKSMYGDTLFYELMRGDEHKF